MLRSGGGPLRLSSEKEEEEEFPRLFPTAVRAPVIRDNDRSSGAGGGRLSLVLGAVAELAQHVAGAQRRRFPGPLCVSMDERAHRAGVAGAGADEYWVCEKTDGARYMLAFLRDWSSRYAVLVDRRMRGAYTVPFAGCSDAMFAGTLLDGELAVTAGGEAVFCAFDAVALADGGHVATLPFPQRIARAAAFLEAHCVHAPSDPVRVCLKRFARLGDVAGTRALLAEARRAFATDGVVLTPASAPVRAGRHDAMFKLKPPGHHTVDFAVADDGVGLLVASGRRVAEVAAATVAFAPGQIVECAPPDDLAVLGARDDPPPRAWRVVAVRRDKLGANDDTTFLKTVLNAREGLTLEQVEGWVLPAKEGGDNTSAHPPRLAPAVRLA